MIFYHKYKQLLISVVLPACLLCNTFQPYSCFAQPYTFSVDTGIYTDLSTPISLNNDSTWDDPEYHISIGFTFEFFDQSFDSIHISDYPDYMWFDNNKKYRIDAFSADFIDRGYPDSSVSPISYRLTGAAGSYVLKIEWNNAGFWFDATTNDYVNVQLWLYEGNNNIEVHIGPNSVINPSSYDNGNTEGASVGLSNDTIEKIYLTGAANSPMLSTVPDFLTGTPLEGIIYKFSKTPSGINSEHPLIKNLYIYPNPTKDILNISFDNIESKRIQIKITDLTGRTLYEKEATNLNFIGTGSGGGNNLSINISKLQSAPYFIKIQTDKLILIGKIIKL